MSRNFELLRRVERERQQRTGTDLPRTPEPRSGSPLYDTLFDPGEVKQESSWTTEPLLAGEVIDSLSVPLHKGAREKVVSLVRGLFLLPASTVRSVAIAATEPSTEVAAITLAAAECLANLTSERVCVVDVDFDRPQLHRHFRPRSPQGLSDVLQGKAELASALTRTASNLWILPAGTVEQPAAGYRSEGLLEVMAAVRRETDFLLLQSPPLIDTSAAIAFGKMTDGMIVVVEANRTRRDFAQTLKGKLDAAHVRILGAIFNNRRFPIPEKIYSKL
jgi:Mrp family chromosome partitioning ATPase